MDKAIKEYILAIVTINEARVLPGGCPLFIASNQDEQERISLLLARVLGGMVHDLENGVYIIVKH